MRLFSAQREEKRPPPFADAVYRREPAESRARLLAHLRGLLPGADEAELARFLN